MAKTSTTARCLLLACHELLTLALLHVAPAVASVEVLGVRVDDEGRGGVHVLSVHQPGTYNQRQIW